MEDTHIGQFVIPVVAIIVVLLFGLAVWSQNGAPDVSGTAVNAVVEREAVGQGSMLARGAADASVGVVVFSDFDCLFCRQFARQILPRIQQEFGGQIALYWRDFPFLGQESWDGANAARCAAEQEHFWQYHDKLFASDDERLTREMLTTHAEELGLNVGQFSTCLAERRYQGVITADKEAGKQLGVQGTPTVFIGALDAERGTIHGERIVGARAYEVYVQAIERALVEQ